MTARYPKLTTALLAAAVAVMAGLTGVPGHRAPLAAASMPPPSSKLAPSLVRLLDQQDGAQKVWIFFADKAVASPEEYDRAIAQVAATYNKRAVERRRLRADNAARGGALFDSRDLPVVDAYIDAVAATGADVHVTSRWLNAVSAYATPKQIRALAAMPFVAKIQPVAKHRHLEPIDVADAPPPAPFPLGRLDYGNSTAQLTQINLIALHEAGYAGDGVIVGILDTGFAKTHEAFHYPGHELEIVAQYDFVDDDPEPGPEPGDPSSQHNHGTYILGVLASYNPGTLVGGAFDASFILAKTEDTTDEYPAEEDNFVAGLEFIEANGGDMFTSSLGYIDWYDPSDLDGETAVTTIAVNIITANGVHGCTAAGNEYHDDDPATNHLIAPSDAYQVIACGAVDSGGDIASFSSDGPSADGRVKPEVLARGVSTHTVDPNDDDDYTTVGGTSLSTPLVACAVACLIDAHPEWTPDDLRTALFNTADYYKQYGTFEPKYIRGYGILDAMSASQGITFSFPDGLPTVIEAGAETTLPVKITENYDGPIQTGSEKMFHRVGESGQFTESPLTHLGGEDYEATLPALPQGSLLQFYFEVQTTDGTCYRAPIDAPDEIFQAEAIGLFYAFDMETDPGWTAEDQWAYGKPTGGGGQYGFPDPTSGHTGPNVLGYNLDGDYPNDLPERHLTTQPFDCSQLTGVTLRFWRWLGVEQPDFDHAYIRLSTDGITWTTIWENTTEITDNDWVPQEFDLSALADGQPTVYIRWTMGETDGGWRYCGWNIDDIELWASGPPECPADITGDGVVDVLDLLEVLAQWGTSGAGGADITGDGIVDVLDLLEVLAAWGPCE